MNVWNLAGIVLYCIVLNVNVNVWRRRASWLGLLLFSLTRAIGSYPALSSPDHHIPLGAVHRHCHVGWLSPEDAVESRQKKSDLPDHFFYFGGTTCGSFWNSFWISFTEADAPMLTLRIPRERTFTCSGFTAGTEGVALPDFSGIPVSPYP
jgi:hypothetical protein